MPRATNDVKKILLKKGFREDFRKSRDHHYYSLHINGIKQSVTTKISRGSHKDISDSLFKRNEKTNKTS